jgi:hypothetical protein
MDVIMYSDILSISHNSGLHTHTLSLCLFTHTISNKTKQTTNRGKRGRIEYPSMRLDSPKSKNDDGTSSSGPVFMVVTEMDPDTILINEIEKTSGMIIMTSSLSVVYNDAGDQVKELIQISHEVSSSPNNKNKATNTIEGHQVWRFHPTEGVGLDFQ